MKEFPATVDAAIVGGGVFGLSVAAWLARAGRHVAVLERASIGSGSSGRSGAIVRSFYRQGLLARGVETCRNEIWTRFEEIFEGLPGEEPAFRRTGLVLYGPEEEREALSAHFAASRVRMEVVARDAVAGAFPYLREPAEGEILWHEPEAGYARSYVVLGTLARYVRNHGGHVFEDCPVHSARATQGGTWRLMTPRGPLSAGALVIAAGPWASRVARELAGVGDLRVRPRKVQVLLLQRPLPAGPDHATIVDVAGDFYSRALPGGASHVGFLSPFDQMDLADADDFDESVRPDLARHLARRFAARHRTGNRALVVGHRPAMYEVTPDENFILGAGPLPGLFFATGGSGHGYKFGPLIGREIANLVAGESAPFASDPAFRWDRDFRGPRAFV